MSQTVVGIFNNTEDAQHALHELHKNGFDDSNVDFARGSGEYATEEHRREHETGVSRFFRHLFGEDESHRYERVAKNGCIVTVHAQSTEQARRASEILDDCGAVAT